MGKAKESHYLMDNLAINAQFFEAILDHIPEMIFVKEPEELRFVRVNKANEKITGVSNEEHMGKTDFDFHPRELAEQYRKVDREVLKTNKIKLVEEDPLFSKTKGLRYMRTKKFAILNKSDGKRYLVGITEDITERKMAEQALRQSENRFKDISESIGDLIWEIDTDMRYVFVSGRVHEILGYNPEEFMGKTPFELLAAEQGKEKKNEFIELIQNRSPIKDLESWKITKAGKRVCLLSNGVPVINEHGELVGYRGVDKDITGKKTAEEELREHLNAKEKYLSILSHEIRNPLNSILGILNSFQERPTEGKSQFIELLKSNGEHMLNLINNVLDYSKINSSNFAFHEENVQLSAFLEKLLQAYKLKLEKKECQIESDFSGIQNDLVTVDPTCLQQIIENLLNNAIKYAGKGKVSFKVYQVDIRNKPKLIISIKDAGPGIEESLKDKIFQPYWQSERNGQHFKGVGLGLSIVQAIVQSLKGTIKVYSTPGKGSVFKVSLPVKVNSEKQVKCDTENSSYENFKVLYVEDVASQRFFVKELCKNHGIEITTSSTGREALAKLNNHNFDLVLLDCGLPDFTGTEMVKSLREKSSIPIVLVSAKEREDIDKEFAGIEFDDYIQKPLSWSNLHPAVNFIYQNNIERKE